jgi:hypothetical protein
VDPWGGDSDHDRRRPLIHYMAQEGKFNILYTPWKTGPGAGGHAPPTILVFLLFYDMVSWPHTFCHVQTTLYSTHIPSFMLKKLRDRSWPGAPRIYQYVNAVACLHRVIMTFRRFLIIVRQLRHSNYLSQCVQAQAESRKVRTVEQRGIGRWRQTERIRDRERDRDRQRQTERQRQRER